MNNLSKHFFADGVATKDTRDGLIAGHPPGGAAIFWKKFLDPRVKVLKFDLNWMIGLQINQDDKEITILNIYLPHCSRDNEEDYILKLGQLINIIDDIESPSIIVMGDFNANIQVNKVSRFGLLLTEFCNDNNLKFISKERLPADSYSFISDIWHTESWLDHVISSHEASLCIGEILVRKDLSFTDHLPLEVVIKMEALNQFQHVDTRSRQDAVHWDDVSDDNLNRYTNFTAILGQLISLPSVVFCDDINCNSLIHKEEISEFYMRITNCMNESAGLIANNRAGNNGQGMPNRNVAGWTRLVEEHHERANLAFDLWVNHGKPRVGPLFELKRRTHYRYKYAIRHVKRNETRIRNDNLARKIINKDHSFWRDINRDISPRLPIPNKIDNMVGAKEIVDFWKTHYKNIYNSVSDSSFNFNLVLSEHDRVPAVSVSELMEAINDIKNIHSKGQDNLSISHFKFASRKIHILLALCYKTMFMHGFIPDSVMLTTITPIVKDKQGSFTASNNYRPISVSNVSAKILERIILKRIWNYLTTNHNQFGFKGQHGVDMALYLVKDTISRYLMSDSIIFVCLLDASKAFDRVHHTMLFRKLIDRGIPLYIVKIMSYWYAEQKLCVKWGQNYSDKFKITNGVRQGSVISPLLYNVYIDQLSDRLNALNVGCAVGEDILNHACYADDLLLLSPSSSGMRKLLETCSGYGQTHDIKFNAAKSVSMVFRGRRSPLGLGGHSPALKLNGDTIPRKSTTRYLGYQLREDLSDDDDILNRRKFIFAQGNKLIKFFSKCSRLIKVKLVKTYLSQIFCIQLWTKFKRQNFSKLKSAYNSVIRRLFWVPRFSEGPEGELISFSASGLLVPLNINGMDSLRRIAIYRFSVRLNVSENCFISSALLYRPSSRVWGSWMVALHVTRVAASGAARVP